MSKNCLNYKFVNFLLIILMIYFIYESHRIWLGLFTVILNILGPFLIAFMISYALYPFLRKLIDKHIPKGLAIFIIIFLVLGILTFLFILIFPTILNQVGDIFASIITFLKEFSNKYNIYFYAEEALNKTFNNILFKISENISSGALNILGLSLNYVTKAFIVLSATIYFLIDMDKIRLGIKTLLYKNKKLYRYVIVLDDEMAKYLEGFFKISFISFFEYLIVYAIIGHPNYLMLGTLASIGNLIPYFGGIVTNIIAIITSLAVSQALFLKTLIALFVFSIVDGYIINPHIFGKTNKLHPLAIIIAIFAGGILFKGVGVIIALPLTIILLATIKYFKLDILKISKKRVKKG